MPLSWVLITVGSIMVAIGLAALVWVLLDLRRELKLAKINKSKNKMRYVRKPRSRKWTGQK